MLIVGFPASCIPFERALHAGAETQTAWLTLFALQGENG